MRGKRFLGVSHESRAVKYHTISRVVNREFVFGGKEKTMFVKIMRQYEAFCGVQVLSYCIMSNHFHMLVEVPPKKKGSPVEMSDENFLAKLKALYSPDYFRDQELMLKSLRKGPLKSDIAAEAMKAKFTSRMYDLSEFMRGVKQRFSQWFNKEHQRVGTLWESRFKSILIEDGYAARVISAYIDLNPIRAGMVEKPEDYRWSSYGESMKSKNDTGRTLARSGICRVLQTHRETGGRTPKDKSYIGWTDGAADRYRMMLFADGEEVFIDHPSSGKTQQIVRTGLSRRDVEKTLQNGGKLTFGESLRCRVRYYTDGMAVGRRAFTEHIFTVAREQFGEKRKSGSRPIRGISWQKKETKLFTMRQLRKNILG